LFLKYNFPKHLNYNPKFGSDKHVKELINSYSAGEKILSKDIIERKQQQTEKENLILKEENKNNIIQEVTEKINEFFINKEKEVECEIKSFLEKELNEKPSKEIFTEEKVQIKLNLPDLKFDINLPKEVNNMPVGTRFIVYDSNKKIIGLKIEEIVYDYVSYEEEVVKEITISQTNQEI